MEDLLAQYGNAGAGASERTPANNTIERKARVELADIQQRRLMRPVVLFTHGNYIQQFIKHVTKSNPAGLDRPNYSAFQFNVEMKPTGPRITYDGPIPYAADMDSASNIPYAISNRIDKEEECADGGDRCITAACPSTTRVRRALENVVREKKAEDAFLRELDTANTAPMRESVDSERNVLKYNMPLPRSKKPVIIDNNETLLNNSGYYQDERSQGGRRTRRRTVRRCRAYSKANRKANQRTKRNSYSR